MVEGKHPRLDSTRSRVHWDKSLCPKVKGLVQAVFIFLISARFPGSANNVIE